MDEQELLKELMAEGISVLLSPDKAAKKIAEKFERQGRLNELKECINALSRKPYYQLHDQVDMPGCGYVQPLFYELLENQGISLDSKGFLRFRGEKVAILGDTIVLLKGKEEKAKEALKAIAEARQELFPSQSNAFSQALSNFDKLGRYCPPTSRAEEVVLKLLEELPYVKVHERRLLGIIPRRSISLNPGYDEFFHSSKYLGDYTQEEIIAGFKHAESLADEDKKKLRLLRNDYEKKEGISRRKKAAIALATIAGLAAAGGVMYALMHKPQQPSQPSNGQPTNGGQPSNGQPSNGTQPGNGGTPPQPTDTVPPSLSVDYRFYAPDKLGLTASASDASGVSQVIAEVFGRNYTMPLVGSLYQLNVTDGNLHDVDSIPVRVFAFDAKGNVALRQLTAVPQLDEKFVSYAVANSCEESIARQFYSAYESLVKQLYPKNASMLLPCLSLYGSNSTVFSELHRNVSGDGQVTDKNTALSEAAKLFLELGYTGKVKVLNPATGSYKEEFLSVPTILALGNYSVAVSQGLPKHDRQTLFLLGNATQINPAIADFEPVVLKDYEGNVFAIKSKNVARDHWMIAEHLRRTPEVLSHPEMYEAFGIKVQQNADDIIDSGKEMRPPSYEKWDAKPTDEAIWSEIIIPQWQYYWSGAPQSGNASRRVCVLPWYNSTLLRQWISNSTDRKIALMYLWELPNAVADLDSGFPLTFHRGLDAMAYTCLLYTSDAADE